MNMILELVHVFCKMSKHWSNKRTFCLQSLTMGAISPRKDMVIGVFTTEYNEVRAAANVWGNSNLQRAGNECPGVRRHRKNIIKLLYF